MPASAPLIIITVLLTLMVLLMTLFIFLLNKNSETLEKFTKEVRAILSNHGDRITGNEKDLEWMKENCKKH